VEVLIVIVASDNRLPLHSSRSFGKRSIKRSYRRPQQQHEKCVVLLNTTTEEEKKYLKMVMI